MNQSLGNTSPSDRARRSEGDRSPQSVAGSDLCGSESRRIKSSERITLKIAMDKAAPTKKAKAASGSTISGFLVFGKMVNALLLLFGGILLGALAVTGSVDWIYQADTNSSPFISCPSNVEVIGATSALDGSACEVRFSFDSFASFDYSVKNAFQPYNAVMSGAYKCFQRASYTDCSTVSQCQVRCYSNNSCTKSIGSGTCTDGGLVWGPQYAQGAGADCSQTVELSSTAYPVQGASISAEPLCGTNLYLTPSIVMTLRGELVAIVLLTVLVGIALMVKGKVTPYPTFSPGPSQKSLLIVKTSANELKAHVESRWDAEHAAGVEEPAIANHNGPKFETGSLVNSQGNKRVPPVHPAQHFASSSWKYRVRVMHAMMKKRDSREKRRALWKSLGSAILLLGATFGFTVLLLTVLPSSYPFDTVIRSTKGIAWDASIESIFSPIYTGQSWVSGVWVDALVLADVVVELAMVILATLFGLKWQPLSSERELKRLSQIGACEEACLVLMVTAGTCLKTRGKDKLVALIQKGLNELKFGAVFVVDMGPGNAPLDDTWKIAAGQDPENVHYVYLPGTNRSLGQFWLSHIWIPFLQKSGRISRLFKQMLVVDVNTVTSKWNMDMGTANRLLMIADGNIEDTRGTMIMMPTQNDQLLGVTGEWENIRLKSNYFARMTEASITNGMVLSASPSDHCAVWDRRALNIGSDDPTQVALSATRRRGHVVISAPTYMERIPVSNTVFQLYASQAAMLPNTLSQLRELLLSISSFVNGSSVGLKFLIIAGPLLSVLVSLFRPLVLASLLFRDPLCLAFLLGVFLALSWLTQAVSSISQWRRTKDLASKYGAILTYPIYQLYLGMIGVGLLISGATFGGTGKSESDSCSTATHRELYPCLPHPDVDWFTCWKTSDASRLSVLSSAVDFKRSSTSLDTVSDYYV